MESSGFAKNPARTNGANVSLRINTNIAAMTALRNLNANGDNVQGSIERLSSGLRINSASDDPAGLIISEGMRSQISGLQQAMSNSQDAINMTKTAEGALQEVQRLLGDMRSLAVASANTAVADANTLQANQTQIRSSIDSINRIAQETQFGTKKLLDGTAGVLANVTNASDASSIYVGGTFAGETVTTGPVTIARVTQGTRATAALTQTFASASSIVTSSGSFVINGYSFSTNGSETVQSLVDRINSTAGTTGVTANLVPNGGNVSVALSQNNYGSHYGITYFDPSGVLNGASSVVNNGVDAVYNVSATTIAANGVTHVSTSLFTGGRGAQDSGLKLTDTYGNAVMLTENGNASVVAATQVGTVTVGSMRFQIGAFADQNVSFSLPTVFADRLGTGAVAGASIAAIDLTNQQGADNAIKIIDDAVTQLAQLRGQLGSFQKNFLESNTRSLDVAKTNLTASESTIRDADMAEEMTEYTKEQILQQSGLSMLAQANQQPQNILTLLKGA